MNSYDKYDMMSEEEQWRYVEGLQPNFELDNLQHEMRVKVRESVITEDHFTLTMNGYMLGTFNRGQLRHMIEQIDNQLNTGL